MDFWTHIEREWIISHFEAATGPKTGRLSTLIVIKARKLLFGRFAQGRHRRRILLLQRMHPLAGAVNGIGTAQRFGHHDRPARTDYRIPGSGSRP